MILDCIRKVYGSILDQKTECHQVDLCITPSHHAQFGIFPYIRPRFLQSFFSNLLFIAIQSFDPHSLRY